MQKMGFIIVLKSPQQLTQEEANYIDILLRLGSQPTLDKSANQPNKQQKKLQPTKNFYFPLSLLASWFGSCLTFLLPRNYLKHI